MPFRNAETYFQDETFLRWVRADAAQEPGTWAALLAKYPGQTEALQQARYLFRELHRAETAHELPDAPARLAAAWEAIQQEIREEEPELAHETRRVSLGRWLAAACFLLGLGTLTWWGARKHEAAPETATVPRLSYRALVETVRQAQPLLETHNTSSVPQPIALPDGSRVQLSPGSRLSYPARFEGTRREVVLTGDAFFEIRKNSSKPFYVLANEVVTKVLGTSFRVRAYEADQNVVVTVKTGQVSVYARAVRTEATRPLTPTLVLTPNQRAVYQREAAQFRKDLIERPVLLNEDPAAEAFAFDDVPLTKVFDALERAYGVRMVYDREALRECTLTATFSDETLYERLDLLARTLGLRYEVVDAQIVFSGRGCSE